MELVSSTLGKSDPFNSDIQEQKTKLSFQLVAKSLQRKKPSGLEN